MSGKKKDEVLENEEKLEKKEGDSNPSNGNEEDSKVAELEERLEQALRAYAGCENDKKIIEKQKILPEPWKADKWWWAGLCNQQAIRVHPTKQKTQ